MEKKSISIEAVYAGLAALIPQGKRESIVGYYSHLKSNEIEYTHTQDGGQEG